MASAGVVNLTGGETDIATGRWAFAEALLP